MGSTLDNTLYHQTKTPIDFWYKQVLNLKSLIQSLETLRVEVIGIRNYIMC